MEDNGAQNTNIIMQTLLSIQNSINKQYDDVLNTQRDVADTKPTPTHR